ncbi:uncharacterized mitochondrial protein-like protein [Tanacetum coccineum]
MGSLAQVQAHKTWLLCPLLITTLSALTNKAVNAAYRVTTASTQVNTTYSTNIDNLSDAFICSFFPIQPNSPQLAHEDLQQIPPYDIEEMDLRLQMAMLTMRARRFLKNIGRKLTVNGNETIEEGPNYTLMAYSSSSSDSEVSNDSDCSKSCMEIVKLLKSQNDQLLRDLEKSSLMVLGYKTDDFVNKHVVENRKSDEEVSKIVRKNDDAPIIEEWVSDSEEENVSQPKTKKKTVKPSIAKIEFVKPKQQEKTARKTDKGVIDSGCSRHMTGNMSYLTDYEEIDGGYVTFGGNPKGGKIIGKATNDETSGILKSFITGIEYLVDHKVKVIRCDNGTEFKNREMNQLCEMKGILRQFSVARTPQQNEVAKRRNMTLIEAARTMLADSKTPTLSFIRPFGCPVTILNTIDHLGKFDGKADEGFFIGYSLNSKAFRVFNSRTKIVEENLHIRFSECTPNVAGSRLNWLFDIDALTRTMNYEPIVAGTQSNGFTDPKSSHDDGSKPSSGDGKKVDKDPRKDSEYKDQENEDNVNSTNNVNAASTNEVNVVGAKKSIELPIDPNMPALEDISIFNFSRGDEDNDIETDINNLDTTIQVSPNLTTRIHKDHPLDQVIGDLQSATQTRRMSKNLENIALLVLFNKEQTIKTFKTACLLAFYHKKNPKRTKAIRLFLAYASFKDFVMYQMDVKSAFLYGKIKEELYVCQPPGFEDPDFPDRVYKVEKALYGLHQAPRAWYETLSTYLLDNEFQRGKIDKTLFIKRYKGDILLVQDVKTASTPMETQKPLLKDEDGKEVDVHMYRSMIGSLMYLTSSRPDIMFAVCACARYQVNPKVSHLHHVKRIFSKLEYEVYNRRLLIPWKQINIMAVQETDSGVEFKTEAEYMAASSCCGQKQKPRKPKRKDTQISQSSSLTKHVADEVVYKELDDSLVRAATTASSLEAKHDSGNIAKTQSKATVNESSSLGTTLGGGPKRQETIGDTITQTRFENVSRHSNDTLLARGNTLQSGEDSLKHNELMELCTNLQTRVLDLEKTKTIQAEKIVSLKRRKQKKTMITYLKNMEDLVEGSSKQAGDKLEQEVTKKQKVDDVYETTEVDDDSEAAKFKELMEIVPDEEEVAIDAIHLATKPPTIVDWKIHKEGKKNYY